MRLGSLLRRARNLRWKRLPWHTINGHVDRPGHGQPFRQQIDVEGWACAIGGPVIVTIWCGETVLRTLDAALPRPDVARRFPRWPGSDRSGFETIIQAHELPAANEAWLRFEAATAPDSPRPSRRTLSIRRVDRRAAVNPEARAAYGAVWDRASASPSEARYAVAGDSDIAEYARTGRSTAEAIARQAAITSNDVVLEIGCGTGRVGAALAPRCHRWIGADVSDNMLRHAERTLRGHRNVSFQLLTGGGLHPIPDNSIDVVYSTAVFMHLDEWDRFRYVVEAHRVLKPGGRLYYDNFNLLTDEGWELFQRMARLDPLCRPPNISKSSTPEELVAYGRRAGFDHVQCVTGGLWVTVIARKARTGDAVLGQSVSGANTM
jgi:SAM-dependent methyltransferase